MTVAAARALANDDICFVGIGLPSAACNLARLTHAPRLTLDLRVGHARDEARRPAALDRRRRAVRDRADDGVGAGDVSVLAAGRPHLGRLSRRRAGRSLRQPEQHGDRRYRTPKVRLPGSGGATEIATCCGRIYIVMRQTPRSFVEDARLHHIARPRADRPRAARDGHDDRGPALVVTDLCMMKPHPDTKEFDVVSLHPGVTRRSGPRTDRLGRSLRRRRRDDAGARCRRARRRCAI